MQQTSLHNLSNQETFQELQIKNDSGDVTQEIWTWAHSAHFPPHLSLDLFRNGNRLFRNIFIISRSHLPLNSTKETVQATYSDAGSSGIEDTGKQATPLRREYPTDKMANNEILSPLSKVRSSSVNHFFEPTDQGVPMYNAYERDIAVLNLFFGDSTVFGRWSCNLTEI